MSFNNIVEKEDPSFIFLRLNKFIIPIRDRGIKMSLCETLSSCYHGTTFNIMKLSQ